MCPFMGLRCDGGGNRPQSNVNLKNHPELSEYFLDGLSSVPSGVCSLQLGEGQAPWIVCPRRLLFLGKSGEQDLSYRDNQQFVENLLLKHCTFPKSATVGVWPEVKLKYIELGDTEGKSFDSTFDYILMPVGRASQDDIEAMLQKPWEEVESGLKATGYEVIELGGKKHVKRFPIGHPVIVEIMTSSTSGGNKRRRTTIPMAFEDAVLRQGHTGPSINYRQVWARMVSQLIVKSEVGMAWGGKTIWILQDRLVDYISKSTALDINAFATDTTSEVNILSFSYGDTFTEMQGVIRLRTGDLYAGPISPKVAKPEPSFQDMIRTGVKPPLSALMRLLLSRLPAHTFQV